MDIKFKVDSKRFAEKMGRVSKVVQTTVMPLVYREFVRNTPVAAKNGGNARAHTSFNTSTARIEARYPYAEVLDKGRGYRDGQMRGSLQAPQGMSKPTIDYARKLIKQFIQQQGK